MTPAKGYQVAILWSFDMSLAMGAQVGEPEVSSCSQLRISLPWASSPQYSELATGSKIALQWHSGKEDGPRGKQRALCVDSFT